MIRSGLVSVTFRGLEAQAVLDLVQTHGIEGIEWGGDIHLPPGETGLAETLWRESEARGIRVAAYGSYYRTACPDTHNPDFEAVLETAQALRSPLIRVWPGPKSPHETSDELRMCVLKDLERIATRAAEEGIVVGMEMHGKTLTETNESMKSVLEEVPHPNLRILWQFRPDLSLEENHRNLDVCLPRLCNLHIFHWDAQYRRLPLEEGSHYLPEFIERADREGVAADRFALIEFVRNDDPEQLTADARALHAWIRNLQSPDEV